MNEDVSTRYLIKFRAFDLDSGELYKWDMYESYPLTGVRASCPQESTGLQDKNEQDIYLGDIVNYQGVNYLTCFINGGYLLKNLETVSENNYILFSEIIKKQHELEIVGNTFNNSAYLAQCFKI